MVRRRRVVPENKLVAGALGWTGYVLVCVPPFSSPAAPSRFPVPSAPRAAHRRVYTCYVDCMR